MRDGEERESKSESDKRVDGETSTGDPRGVKERKRTSGRFGKLNRGSERGRERERERDETQRGARRKNSQSPDQTHRSRSPPQPD